MSTRRRVTVPVKYLRERVNFLLGNKDATYNFLDGMTPAQAYRLGAASILEGALLETDNWAGFGYHDVDHDVTPPAIPDETRRVYYRKA